jgi:hypothetical protein
MVHTLDQDRPAAVVDHGNDSGQVIARGLRFRSRDDLSRNLQGQHLFYRKLCRRRCRQQRGRSYRARTRWRYVR